MPVSRIRAALAAACLSLILSACSSVSINTEDRWDDPQFKGQTYQHVLLVGITADPGVRGVVERGFAEGMSRGDLTVTAGSDLMPPSGRVTRDMVLRYTEGTDIDAVITVLVMNFEVEETNRGRYYVDPVMAWNSTAYRVDTMLGAGGPPPTGVLTLRYSFFDLQQRELIWTADTVVRNIGSVEQLIRVGHPELSRTLTTAGLTP